MKKDFLIIANELNARLNIIPLLFGSLGLEQRLGIDLNAEDIDVLVPEEYLNEKWQSIVSVMEDNATHYMIYMSMPF